MASVIYTDMTSQIGSSNALLHGSRYTINDVPFICPAMVPHVILVRRGTRSDLSTGQAELDLAIRSVNVELHTDLFVVCAVRSVQCQARDEWWCNNPSMHCRSARRNRVLGPVQRRDWGKWALRAQFGMSRVYNEASAWYNPFTRSSVWCRVASRFRGGEQAGVAVGGVKSHGLRPMVYGRRWG